MLSWQYSIPLLLIGGTIAFYWQQVLRMASKQRKRTGKAANLIPPEPLGRLLRILWTPIVVIWIAHPVAAAFWADPPAVARPLFAVWWITWLSAGIVMAGMAITRSCWKRMGRNWRMGIDPSEKTSLVFDGLFAYVRHPIYALSAGMMSATMVALPTPLMLTAGLLHIVLLVWESAREERHLLAVHGRDYQMYRQRVGRLIPWSVRPYGRA